jgi:hypothetical protein
MSTPEPLSTPVHPSAVGGALHDARRAAARALRHSRRARQGVNTLADRVECGHQDALGASRQAIGAFVSEEALDALCRLRQAELAERGR